ncbi:MAG: hypothetical protein WKG03_16420 [Telluria sp.]
MRHLQLKPLYALGITVCRYRVPVGRRFLAVTDDFGRLVEVGDGALPACPIEH